MMNFKTLVSLMALSCLSGELVANVHKQSAEAVLARSNGLNHVVDDYTSLSGKATQGSLLIGKTLPGTKITLNDNVISVSEDGDFVIGFGRDAQLNHKLTLDYNAPNKKNMLSKTSHTLSLAPREYREQRVTGISKKISNPNPKNIARARLDAKQVRAARAIWSDETYFTQTFIWPYEGIITGVYGSVRYYNGKKGRPHYGIDIAGPKGSDVVAPADGIIRMYVPDMFYSGGTMIIDHGMYVSSTFLHLSESVVNVGDAVKQGQVVAKIGSTGRSTGPHLDWRMNWNDQRVDPQLLVPSR